MEIASKGQIVKQGPVRVTRPCSLCRGNANRALVLALRGILTIDHVICESCLEKIRMKVWTGNDYVLQLLHQEQREKPSIIIPGAN